MLRYLRGIYKVCLYFGNSSTMMEAYTNLDMLGDLNQRSSTSTYLFTFVGGSISYKSNLQKYVTLSTIEIEYIASTEACKEMLCLKYFLTELDLE